MIDETPEQRERRLAYRRAYYQSHKLECRAYSKKYREANRDKIRKLKRDWARANPDKVIGQRERFSPKRDAQYRAKKDTPEFKQMNEAYRIANRQAIRIRNKLSRELDPEAYRAYQRVYREWKRDELRRLREQGE